jgi:hypothetical protein
MNLKWRHLTKGRGAKPTAAGPKRRIPNGFGNIIKEKIIVGVFTGFLPIWRFYGGKIYRPKYSFTLAKCLGVIAEQKINCEDFTYNDFSFNDNSSDTYTGDITYIAITYIGITFIGITFIGITYIGITYIGITYIRITYNWFHL